MKVASVFKFVLSVLIVVYVNVATGSEPTVDEAVLFADLPPIAVVVRHPLSAPPAVGQDLWASQPRAPGCAIRVFEPRHPNQPAKTIFSDPDGCI